MAADSPVVVASPVAAVASPEWAAFPAVADSPVAVASLAVVESPAVEFPVRSLADRPVRVARRPSIMRAALRVAILTR